MTAKGTSTSRSCSGCSTASAASRHSPTDRSSMVMHTAAKFRCRCSPSSCFACCLVVLALSWGWNTSHWTADSNEEHIMPLDQTRSPSGDHRRVWALRPVLSAWALTIGLDLFFNAGVFMPLFDQEREPSLLPDEVLFRRIPVAYAALLIGVAFLAYAIDRVEPRSILIGAAQGGLLGVVLASMGIVSLWTAIDMTGTFVAAGSLVVVLEFAAAAAVLAAFRLSGRRDFARRVLLLALLAAVGGIVVQNLWA